MLTQNLLPQTSTTTATCPRIRHIVTGTFNTPYLHVLAYDTLTKSLTVENSIEAQGPHQFLALGRVRQPGACVPPSSAAGGGGGGQDGKGKSREAGQYPNVLYATTWDDPPSLSAWKIVGLEEAGSTDKSSKGVTLEWINTQPITATSSYVHVQPPPYDTLTAPGYGVASTSGDAQGYTTHLYSAGGPTGEVHAIDSVSGAIMEKVQELVFLRPPPPPPSSSADATQQEKGEEERLQEALRQADKTRKALRYGAHSFDISAKGIAYVADLGRDGILSYRVGGASEASAGSPNLKKGKDKGKWLEFLHDTPSPRREGEGESAQGPRHVVPSPDGRWVFAVTEHTSYVDIYAVGPSSSSSPSQQQEDIEGSKLKHVRTLDILPASQRAKRHDYRGDTLRLTPDGNCLVASTRGKISTREEGGERGLITVWRLVPSQQGAGAGAGDEREGSSKEGMWDHLQTSEPERLCTLEIPTSGGKANAIEFAPRWGAISPSSATPPSITDEHKSNTEEVIDMAVVTDDEQGYVWVMEWDGVDLRRVAEVRLPNLSPEDNGEGYEGASHAVWLS